MILDLVALLSTALFFGACLYVSLVEQPSRLACDVNTALIQWRPSYNRAAIMQTTLALIGVISSSILYLVDKDMIELLAGLILLLVAPMTLVIMKPTIQQLSDLARTGQTPGTMALIKRWGLLHHWRTGISLTALTLQVVHLSASMK